MTLQVQRVSFMTCGAYILGFTGRTALKQLFTVQTGLLVSGVLSLANTAEVLEDPVIF